MRRVEPKGLCGGSGSVWLCGRDWGDLAPGSSGGERRAGAARRDAGAQARGAFGGAAAARSHLLRVALAQKRRRNNTFGDDSIPCSLLPQGHTARLTDVGFTADGELALTASLDCAVRFWAVATGNCLRALSGHTKLVSSLAREPAPRGRWRPCCTLADLVGSHRLTFGASRFFCIVAGCVRWQGERASNSGDCLRRRFRQALEPPLGRKRISKPPAK